MPKHNINMTAENINHALAAVSPSILKQNRSDSELNGYKLKKKLWVAIHLINDTTHCNWDLHLRNWNYVDSKLKQHQRLCSWQKKTSNTHLIILDNNLKAFYFCCQHKYVTSHLISNVSSLTNRHMVLCSPTALAKEWICISWDLRSLLPWNEFYTSLIPDLLFTPWPNMQVGLPDAWLDRNDCPGIQLPFSPRWRSQTEAGSHSEDRGMSLSLPPPPPLTTHTQTHTHILASFNSSLLRCLSQKLSKSSSEKPSAQ